MKKIFALTLLVCGGPLWAAPHYPQPQGYLTDAANILDASDKASLEQQLEQFERATGNEIAVATVPSLEGEPVEMYANELFAQWKIGKKGKDNGILILVAPTEHKARIEVGYGLEGQLPDGLCGQIIREQMLPSFKENNYNQGLHEGIVTIQTILSGGQVFPSVSRRDNPTVSLPQVLGPLGFCGLLVIPFTTIAGAIAIMLFMSAAETAKFLGFLLLPLGFGIDVWRFLHRGSVSRSLGGGYYGGGFGGFGGSFGGGGFGGFGGGSSGGGGASGGW